jgi:hypothetical protein
MLARMLLAVVAVVVPLQAMGQSHSFVWLTSRNGCKIWSPNAVPSPTVAWTGACSGDLAQGMGTALWYHNDQLLGSYRGELRDGKFEGQGLLKLIAKTGTYSYEGGWRDGKREGQGTAVWTDGSRYVGGWRNDKASETGTLVDARGNTFSGTWIGGCLRRPDQQGARFTVAVGATPSECGSRR